MPNKHMLYEIFSLCFAEQWLCEALGNIRGDFEKEYQFISNLLKIVMLTGMLSMLLYPIILK